MHRDAGRAPASPAAAPPSTPPVGLFNPVRARGLALCGQEGFQDGLAALAAIPCTAYLITELIDFQLTVGLIATGCATSTAR
jgi:hypothetical protein